MHDRSRALGQHQREQRAIEADRGKEVEIEFFFPLAFVEGGEPACWCRGAAKGVDNDVHAAETRPHALDDGAATVDGGEVGRHRNEVPARPAGERTRRCQDDGTLFVQALRHGPANASARAGHEDALAVEPA